MIAHVGPVPVEELVPLLAVAGGGGLALAAARLRAFVRRLKRTAEHEARLVLAALQAAVGHELDRGLHDQGGAEALADRRRERRVARRGLGELDGDGQRRLLLRARGGRAGRRCRR